MSMLSLEKRGFLNVGFESAKALYLTLTDYGLNPGDWSICRIGSIEGWYQLSHRQDKDLFLYGYWNADTNWKSLEWAEF